MKATFLAFAIFAIGSTAHAQQDREIELDIPGFTVPDAEIRNFDIQKFDGRLIDKDSLLKQFDPSLDSPLKLLEERESIYGMKPGTLLDTREIADDGITIGGQKYFMRIARPVEPVLNGSTIIVK